jgi:predicted nucleic-acid-binding protein
MKTNKAFIDTSVIIRLLIKDDGEKVSKTLNLIKNAKNKGVSLYILPIALIETVYVLEKVYKISKATVKELIEAILNTQEFNIESEQVFRDAISLYLIKNIKFGDALMSCWAFERRISAVYTYDNKDFKRIEGLEVRKP